MNSYFEQSGFYGQTATGGAAEQAYRFPLGLAGMGVSPYTQHTQPRPPAQDPAGYDSGSVAAAAAVVAATNGTGNSAPSPKAAGLYNPINDYKSSNGPSSGGSAGGGVPSPPAECKDQPPVNGYSSLSKELNSWNGANGTNNNGTSGGAGAGGGGGAGPTGAAANGPTTNGGGGTTPVRPSAGTPDMSRYTPTSVDAMASARDRWMNTCSGLSSASAVAAAASQPQLQQAASPHQTFYPWMAIAGKAGTITHLYTISKHHTNQSRNDVTLGLSTYI